MLKCKNQHCGPVHSEPEDPPLVPGRPNPAPVEEPPDMPGRDVPEPIPIDEPGPDKPVKRASKAGGSGSCQWHQGAPADT